MLLFGQQSTGERSQHHKSTAPNVNYLIMRNIITIKL